MGDELVPSIHFKSAALRTALARASLRARRWIARRRRRGSLADLSDWILRDIGVSRERDIGTGRAADPREEVRQFWLR